jgi:hypothetical protein
MRKLERSLQNDTRITDLRTKKNNAQQRVNMAQRMEPDGPLPSEVSERLNERRNAGGRLDSNRDGVISEAEMKTALASRVSMQQTQYLDEKKLNVDGDNEIGKGERRRGLVQVTGQTALDHNQLLTEARQDPSFRETGIGRGTFVDANGVTRNKQSLNNPRAMQAELDQYTRQRDAAKYSRNNDQMTPTKLRNGQMPTTTHRYAAIRTTGTWGQTRSWNGSWDAGGGINRNINQIQGQMQNPNAGQNNQFYNRAQASTSGFQGATANARNGLAQAQRTQNSTTGFRSAQAEVQAMYNQMNR